MFSVKILIRDFIQKNTFHTSRLGIFVNPFYLCRRALFSALSLYCTKLSGCCIDFGCGTAPYRPLMTNISSYVGLEYDTPSNRTTKNADLFYDGETIPLDNDSIDSILSTQTLEHVPNPERIVSEWARILRSGGQLLITVPFMWPEHEVPYDFQRYSCFGVRKLLENYHFEILEHVKLLCDCRAPAQLFQAWLYDILDYGSRRPLTKLLLCLFLFFPISATAIFLAKITPSNPNTYLDNLILAIKK